MNTNKASQKLSYAQAVGPSVSNILKLKDNFPNLPAKKIKNIQKIIDNSNKTKSHIKITTKGPSQKQIIISISKENSNKFMGLVSIYITNINRTLKNIKSSILVDYAQRDSTGVVIITNKVALSSNLQTIENVIKNVENINSDNIKIPWLPQSKSYLKITGIPFFIKNTNISISTDFVEVAIKSNHIFDNLLLTSKLKVIKVSPKFDIVII